MKHEALMFVVVSLQQLYEYRTQGGSAERSELLAGAPLAEYGEWRRCVGSLRA